MQMMKKEENFYYLSFEDPRLIDFTIRDYELLEEVFHKEYGYQDLYFFDEIQNTEDELLTTEFALVDMVVEMIRTYETELDEWGCDNRTTFLYSAETSKMHSTNHLANQMLFAHQEEDMAKILEWEGCFHVNDILKKLGITKTSQGQKDGRIAEEFGGKTTGLMFTTTLVDPVTETYVIEIPHDGDISGRDGEVYRMAAKR